MPAPSSPFPDNPPAPPPAAPAPAVASAHLVDTRWGVAYPLVRVCTGIGRDDSNPVLIRDPAASRTHCEIQRTGEDYVLCPIGHAETQVNGHRLSEPHRLAEGDLVEIAYSHFRFTRKPPEGDIVVAAPHGPVDQALAGRPTEVREIITPERLQQLRRQMLRPVELHWRILLTGVVVAALVLAVLIRLGIGLLGR